MNPSPPSTNRLQRVRGAKGFSLIELVIVMAIAALLAAIAIPSYTSYILRSHRTEAKSALLDLASMEERYFSTQYSYTSDQTQLGYPAGNQPFPVGSGYYNVILSAQLPQAPTATSAGSPASYQIIAAATTVGNQTNDTACSSFTVQSGGQQSALNAAGTDNTAVCWQQ